MLKKTNNLGRVTCRFTPGSPEMSTAFHKIIDFNCAMLQVSHNIAMLVGLIRVC